MNTGRADEGATIKFPGEDERRAGTIVDLDVRPFANLANLADVHNASEARSKELGYKGLGADGYRSAQRQPQRDPHVFGGHWARQAESLAAQRRDQKRLCETLSIDLAAIRKDFEDAMTRSTDSRRRTTRNASGYRYNSAYYESTTLAQKQWTPSARTGATKPAGSIRHGSSSGGSS